MLASGLPITEPRGEIQGVRIWRTEYLVLWLWFSGRTVMIVTISRVVSTTFDSHLFPMDVDRAQVNKEEYFKLVLCFGIGILSTSL